MHGGRRTSQKKTERELFAVVEDLNLRWSFRGPTQIQRHQEREWGKGRGRIIPGTETDTGRDPRCNRDEKS